MESREDFESLRCQERVLAYEGVLGKYQSDLGSESPEADHTCQITQDSTACQSRPHEPS